MDGLKSALSSDPECGPIPALFPSGKSAKKKTLAQLHLQHQSEIKKLLNPVLGESLEDLHCAELECQRFARRETQLNSVLGGNLDDLHASSPPSCTTRNWNVNDVLGNKLLQRRKRQHRRHFHQLFCQLRVATQPSQRNIKRQNFRHFDNRLGNHRQLCGRELHDIRQLFPNLRHRNIETMDQLVRDAIVALSLPLRPGLLQCL